MMDAYVADEWEVRAISDADHKPKPSSEYTHEQHIVSNLWALYGPGQFVEKVSRGWIVTVLETRIPTVFKTRREAVEAADRLCMAYLERR